MKIDCPHCGVHGSVDDALAGRKLRCPKCSKIFLITAESPPEADDIGMVHQEILYEDEPQSSVTAEQEAVAPETAEEEVVEETEELGEIETIPDDDTNLEQCSVCNQSFAPEFLVEIESELYCALCQPDPEEEELDLFEEDGREDSSDEEAEEVFAEEEGEDSDLMDDEFEDDSEEESVELEICSGCGEKLHPHFLETVGSERYCALCIPGETEGEEDIEVEHLEEIEEIEVLEEIDHEQDEGPAEDEMDSSLQALVDDDEEDDGELTKPCSVCGEKFHLDFMQEVDSKLYCGVCQPEVIKVQAGDEVAVATDSGADTGETYEEEEGFAVGADFTVGELIKEAWQKTKGAKASIWGAMIVMYLILFGISFGGMAAYQGFYKGTDPTMSMGVNGALQLVSGWLSMLMTGGVMLIGVRRAFNQRVSWKMVFAGFSKALSITIAIILQIILILIGFVLLVLPGIYLSVGYALTLPLILDKGMGPWEAMEASRKAIHKRWWSVLGLYLVMMLLYMVSAIPLGLGLIWTVPMFFVLFGVLYVRFFGTARSVEEELEEEAEEFEDEMEEETEEFFEETEQIKE
jgi:hypothetical protein